MKLEPIRSDKHKNAGWLKPKGFSHLASEVLAPIASNELHEIAANFPIAFARVTADEYRCVALLGMTLEQNVFVNAAGRWFNGYIPSVYRAYPFVMGRNPQDENQALLCIDTDTGLFRDNVQDDPQAQPFFQPDGSPAEHLSQAVEFLKSRNAGLEHLKGVVAALSEENLLIPWTLPESELEGDAIQGLYRIDDKAFNELPGEKLESLRDSGALAVIFAHRFSLHRLPRLLEFAKLKASEIKQQDTGAEDLDELFGEGSEVLEFNL